MITFTFAEALIARGELVKHEECGWWNPETPVWVRQVAEECHTSAGHTIVEREGWRAIARAFHVEIEKLRDEFEVDDGQGV